MGLHSPSNTRRIPLRDPRETSSARSLNFRDETERKRMEKELRASESLFRDAFKTARTGIALIDGGGRTYVDVNDAFCEMLGYEREELMQLTWVDITHSDDVDRNVAEVDAMVAGGPSVNDVDKRYLRRDGSVIHVQITDSLVRDERQAALFRGSHNRCDGKRGLRPSSSRE